jgi:hypothetical protein
MKTKKLIYVLFLIATIICATSCDNKKDDLKLSYNCYYNDLPLWLKEIIVIEAIALNIIILSLIIAFIVLKYKLKKLENEN